MQLNFTWTIIFLPDWNAGMAEPIQGSAKRLRPGLVKFVSAVAYHFRLSFPAAFTQPGLSLLADPCRPNAPSGENTGNVETGKQEIPVLKSKQSECTISNVCCVENVKHGIPEIICGALPCHQGKFRFRVPCCILPGPDRWIWFVVIRWCCDV